MTGKTIFKRIIDKEIPARLVHEDDVCLAFHDVNPQAPTHILVIPKEEIRSLDELTESQRSIIAHLLLVIPRVARDAGLSNGYRVVTNIGADGGQSVPHLHFHVLGGRAMGWPPG